MDQMDCPNCGAALPASAAASEVVTCQYCNVTFRIPQTFTPEPDMGNHVLGADFRQDTIPGWGVLNKEKLVIKNYEVYFKNKFIMRII